MSLKMCTYKPCVFFMFIIRCSDQLVKQVPGGWGGVIPTLSLYNFEIILNMVEIPTHKPYVLDSHDT